MGFSVELTNTKETPQKQCEAGQGVLAQLWSIYGSENWKEQRKEERERRLKKSRVNNGRDNEKNETIMK